LEERLTSLTIDQILELISELNDQAVFPEGLEDAIIGYVERAGTAPLVLLDTNKCISILRTEENMSLDEAKEYFEYNILGAFVGDHTPCFATLLKK